jgi:SAM-dependent methyltransferase
MSGLSRTLANDPFSGRKPTSHERMTGLPWDASYYDGPAPWDIGRPQPAIMRLASEGGFAGPVLDAGCGTGENALLVAALGWSVLGVDVADTALAIARRRLATAGSRLSLLRLTRSIWSVWGVCLRRCSTADCSTPSTPVSGQDTWRAWPR